MNTQRLKRPYKKKILHMHEEARNCSPATADEFATLVDRIGAELERLMNDTKESINNLPEDRRDEDVGIPKLLRERLDGLLIAWTEVTVGYIEYPPGIDKRGDEYWDAWLADNKIYLSWGIAWAIED